MPRVSCGLIETIVQRPPTRAITERPVIVASPAMRELLEFAAASGDECREGPDHR